MIIVEDEPLDDPYNEFSLKFKKTICDEGDFYSNVNLFRRLG